MRTCLSPCPRPCVVSVGQLSGDGCPGQTGTFLSNQLVLTESVTQAGNRMGAGVCVWGGCRWLKTLLRIQTSSDNSSQGSGSLLLPLSFSFPPFPTLSLFYTLEEVGKRLWWALTGSLLSFFPLSSPALEETHCTGENGEAQKDGHRPVSCRECTGQAGQSLCASQDCILPWRRVFL